MSNYKKIYWGVVAVLSVFFLVSFIIPLISHSLRDDPLSRIAAQSAARDAERKAKEDARAAADAECDAKYGKHSSICQQRFIMRMESDLRELELRAEELKRQRAGNNQP